MPAMVFEGYSYILLWGFQMGDRERGLRGGIIYCPFQAQPFRRTEASDHWLKPRPPESE
jgi:hypothetical protein